MGYQGGVDINRSIDLVEVDDATIKFHTFKSSVYLGLIKRRPLEVTAPREAIIFEMANNRKTSFDRKLIGDLYILSYAGDTYLVESLFFENFGLMKQLLQPQ